MERGIRSGILWGAAISVVAVFTAAIVGTLPERPSRQPTEMAQTNLAVPESSGGTQKPAVKPAPLPIADAGGENSGTIDISSEIDRLLAEVQPLEARETDADTGTESPQDEAKTSLDEDTGSRRGAELSDTISGNAALADTEGSRTADEQPDGSTTTSVRVRHRETIDAVTSRLPQIGVERDAATQVSMQASVEEDPAKGALSRNAVAFEAGPDRPLVSMILIDAGTGTVSPEEIAALGRPVSVAVDPTAAGAPQRAEAYRSAGLEVIVLANGLPEGATPKDVEVTLQTYLGTYPQAVAVMEMQAGGFGNQRELTAQALAILQASGHGAIGWSRGLGTIRYRNARQPVAMVHRRIDEQAGNAGAIKRSLDRAAFEATQKGSTVVVGSASEATFAAIRDWAAGPQLRGISLAPVSAVLLAGTAR